MNNKKFIILLIIFMQYYDICASFTKNQIIADPNVVWKAQQALKSLSKNDFGESFLQKSGLRLFSTISLWYGMSEIFDKIGVIFKVKFGVPAPKGIWKFSIPFFKHYLIYLLMTTFENRLLIDPSNLFSSSSSLTSEIGAIIDDKNNLIKKINYNYVQGVQVQPYEIEEINQFLQKGGLEGEYKTQLLQSMQNAKYPQDTEFQRTLNRWAGVSTWSRSGNNN